MKKYDNIVYSTDNNFSYSKEDLKNFVCRCGSEKCCGYIVREPSRWRINKKFKISNRTNK